MFLAVCHSSRHFLFRLKCGLSQAGHSRIRDKIFISWSGSCSRITTIFHRNLSQHIASLIFMCNSCGISNPRTHRTLKKPSVLELFCDSWQAIFIFVIFVIFLCLTSIFFVKSNSKASSDNSLGKLFQDPAKNSEQSLRRVYLLWC